MVATDAETKPIKPAIHVDVPADPTFRILRASLLSRAMIGLFGARFLSLPTKN
jgi:hypothetical protein